MNKHYKLVSRNYKSEDTIVHVGNVAIGDGSFVVMAGPCSVESQEQLMEAAKIVAEGGAQFLRGGAFKPRTSPYDFQGLAEKGLQYLREAGDKYNLKIVTEVMEAETIPLVSQYADMLQIGSRNMQNFHLLREVGKTDKPVLLKRGLASTIDEWLSAAEYILDQGNDRVVLCERGIRTYETYTRNTLDLSAIPAVKHLSHLPIIIDPSHGTGKWRMVEAMSYATMASGGDGLIIEVHPDPDKALSDGPQSLSPENYFKVMQGLKKLAPIVAELNI